MKNYDNIKESEKFLYLKDLQINNEKDENIEWEDSSNDSDNNESKQYFYNNKNKIKIPYEKYLKDLKCLSKKNT